MIKTHAGIGKAHKELFKNLLQDCIKSKDLYKGMQVHAYIIQDISSDEPNNLYLENSLLHIYAKCGSVSEARYVFDGMKEHNLFSWTAIISMHAGHGPMEEALNLYEDLYQRSGLVLDKYAFLSALKATISLRCIRGGKHVHADVVKSSLEVDIFVTNTLVDMYAKCYSIEDSQCVFERAVKKDIVTWNAMMTGCLSHGMHEECLRYFCRIQHENMMPNDVSFMSVLRACIGCASLMIGKQIHIQACGTLVSHVNVHVLNTLLDVYAKCGCIENVSFLFQMMPVKDVTTWNVMVSAFAKEGLLSEAYSLIRLMREKGFEPDEVTFSTLLKACTLFPCLENGRFGHLLLVESGTNLDAITSSILMEMYIKCGSYDDAWKVFDGMGLYKNNVGWNVMVAGCVQHGQFDNALFLFHQMITEGELPDEVTALSILKMCPSLTCSFERSFHVCAMEMGFLSDLSVSNALFEMYVKRGSIEDVYRVFARLQVCDVVSWNILIMALVQQELVEDVLPLLEVMLQKQVEANYVTFSTILKACATMAILEWGMQMHSLVVNFDHRESILATSSVGCSLVDMYAKCGSIDDARKVFDGMLEREVVAWTAMISGYSLQGMCEEAFDLWEKMTAQGVKPDCITFVAILSVCTRVGMVQAGIGAFIAMDLLHGVTPTSEHVACMVDLLGRSGLIQEANCLIMKSHPLCDDVVWMALLDACRIHGDIDTGRYAFQCVITSWPSCSQAYVVLSNMYALAGMWDAVLKIRDAMRHVLIVSDA